MRFGGHVPNSLRNKKVERHSPYLRLKMVFWASETLLYPSGIGEKNFLVNFERYYLANGEE
jgi:hypothetical protein